MAVQSTDFAIKTHGISTPCRLFYVMPNKESEYVCFPNGLQGQASFSNLQADVVSAFNLFGLPVYDETQSLSTRTVRPSEKGFGLAFYYHYFLTKLLPSTLNPLTPTLGHYEWRLL